MVRDQFRIWIKPRETLDRLLFDRDMRSSWDVTWSIIIASSLVSLLIFVMLGLTVIHVPEVLKGTEFTLPNQALMWVVLLGIWVGISVVVLVYYVLARFFFVWLVRMGMRVSAGDLYPKSPEERLEKAKLVELIQPYTMAGTVWPGLISNFLYALLAVLFVPQLVENPESSQGLQLGLTSVQGLFGTIGFGMTVYMIAVRVMAICKIYRVSGPQAFWGPFLMYVLAWMALTGVIIAILLMIAMNSTSWTR